MIHMSFHSYSQKMVSHNAITAVSSKTVALFVQGDNDPVDVVEIGSQTGVMGAVYKARL